MAKKSFNERLNEIVNTTVSNTKDGKMKATFSRRMYNDIVNAMVNDENYEVENVQFKGGELVVTKSTPMKEFRTKLIGPILSEIRMDPLDAEKFIKNYEFTKGQTDGFYDLACSSIMEYMKTGKSFRFPNKKDFVAAISLREMPESVYVNPNNGNKTKREGFVTLVKKSTCPVWKRHKM